MKNNIKLTPKQLRFCEHYLQTGNGGQSYIKAYGKPNDSNTVITNTHYVNACNLLKKSNIKAYIKQRTEEMDESLIAKSDEVMKFLTRVMRGEEKDQFDLEASLAERRQAAVEILKRTSDKIDNERVVIQVDIPRPNKG